MVDQKLYSPIINYIARESACRGKGTVVSYYARTGYHTCTVPDTFNSYIAVVIYYTTVHTVKSEI
ncbi:hypothetical protein [Candidatus Odyssella acanthamoebae]|uniref:hypothetical protein n=1 Tax=Candidatus Odyssella acanthamoebae TaxID=91604 RepID=UPI0018DCDB95|nr:hypothetical protein [Candidatus Paracaedibacter acanthamoebae]